MIEPLRSIGDEGSSVDGCVICAAAAGGVDAGGVVVVMAAGLSLTSIPSSSVSSLLLSVGVLLSLLTVLWDKGLLESGGFAL